MPKKLSALLQRGYQPSQETRPGRVPRAPTAKKYVLPLPEHGWRGGGARSPNEGPVRPPSRRHPRGKRYSPRSRPT